jgi:hypothetical protein
MALLKRLRRSASCVALVVCTILPASYVATRTDGSPGHGEVLVDEGWHPWYEIKEDPESRERLIICGTKWDAPHNAPYGFIIASSDGGATWRTTLEDRSSSWVTEHSCAFGPNHRAYFISEASKVLDGRPRHELGTTRLYVSTDSGELWTETAKTEWADYSTSAVSSASGKLYTFFNAMASEREPKRGGHIGLVVFSPDGEHVAGPFFDSALEFRDLESLYPSDAVALKDGMVVALYFRARPRANGVEVELGSVRADAANEPSLDRTTIFERIIAKDCLGFGEGSLAYDAERNRLYVAYTDGCTQTRLMLTSSDDGGTTWAESLEVGDADATGRRMAHPTLVVGTKGVLALLWEDGRRSGRWLFTRIKNQRFVQPATELSTPPEILQVSNDALKFWTYQPGERQSRDFDIKFGSSTTVHVSDEANELWRGHGLVTAGEQILAVWPSLGNGMRLRSALLDPLKTASSGGGAMDSRELLETDVTDHTVILYGGTQHYDNASATLNVCLTLGNRGQRAIKTPIRLEATDVGSPLGTVSILDSNNGIDGLGAIWDVSGSVAGGQIPPGGDSKPFCLLFRVRNCRRHSASGGEDDLVTLRLKVLAARENAP